MRITTILLASAFALAAASADAAVFSVTNTNPSGAGSLHAAITQANAMSDIDVIVFNIEGTGVKVITGKLPTITQPLAIDGYSQAGASQGTFSTGAINAVLRIELDGTGILDEVLDIDAVDVTIRGLAIKNIQSGAAGMRFADGTIDNLVIGNFIGTNAAGTADLSAGTGIHSSGSVRIGGLAAGERNLISGNSVAGIVLAGPDCEIVNNLIGTTASAGGVIGNGDGIALVDEDAGDTLIGGTAVNAGNFIVGNSGAGIVVENFAGSPTTINGNIFTGNGALAIDLGGDGVTENDVDDQDNGVNGLQNYYEVSFARFHGASLRVEGHLNSEPGEYRIEVFRSLAADPSGFGEGQTLISTFDLEIAPGGTSVFDTREIALPITPGSPLFVTATATNKQTGETSEFSPAVRALDGGIELVVTNTLNGGAGSLRAAVTAANAADDINTIAFDIPGDGAQTIELLTGLSLSQPVILDGYSQHGAHPNYQEEGSNAVPLIVLDGVGAGESPGLVLFATDTVVRGLVIHRFFTSGITLAAGSVGSRIEGNFVGVHQAGLLDRGNGRNGVNVLAAASDATIGGPFLHQRNLLSGNTESGIANAGSGTTIQNNIIGGNRLGTSLGNDERGIYVTGSDTLIGTTGARGGNRILSNGQAGVRLTDASEVRINGNDILDNAGLGIELGAQGVTENDTNDGDEGDNRLQNFPVLTSVVPARGGLFVEGFLDVGGSMDARIEIFENEDCDSLDHGEGERFLGAAVVDLTPSSQEFAFVVPVVVEAGSVFTATATDEDGNTSEFSECVGITNTFCGDPNFSGEILASDALLALNAAVGIIPCQLCVCDVNETGMVTTTDAQLILRYSVGHSVVLNCPGCN